MSAPGTWLINQYFSSMTKVVFGVFVLALLFSANSYSELMCSDNQATTDTGSLFDPGGPEGKYSNNQDCGFLIQPSGGGDITLTFSSFNYEYYFDTLTVYEGTDASGPLLGTFTGTSLPSPVVSTVGSLYIVHSTDYSKTRNGFAASWITTAPIPGENRLCRDGGSTLSSGQLTDPGGALANYSNNQDCGFLIQPTDGGDITLTFSSFNYEYFYDDLRIYDGTNSSAKRIGKFTGTNLPASITATSGAMYVVHDTDYSVTRSGFVANWSSAPVNPDDYRLCRDFVSNENSGSLSDPGGPSAEYSDDEDCSFLIQPTDSGDITLSFSEFDYENSYDYLRVYDGSSSAGILLGTFTGTALPSALVASSGAMYVVHETDYSVIKAGFDANWSVATDTPELVGCAAAFPDGLSSHGGGLISFGYNAQLIGSPDNLLAADDLTENGGSSLTTCNTANCSLDPDSVLEPISPGTFQTTASTEDVSVPSEDSVTLGTSGNEYRSVSSNDLASINFSASHDEYKINSLQLGSKTVLNLNANTVYWLNSFTMSSQAVINVVGSGTATLIVNSSLQFTSPVLVNSPAINSSGDASKLALYVYGDIVLNSQSTVSGLIYAQGDLTLISASYIFGAATADNISLNSESVVTYQSSEVIAADLTALCADETGVDHYQIEFLGDGITCEAKLMTIYACADESCDTPYDQPASIDLSPMGWIDSNGVLTDTIEFSESATISLSHTTAETITISSGVASPSADLSCNDGGTGSCDITFADSVIEFFGNNIGEPILDQLAEQEFGLDVFGNVNLRAVKADKGVCVAALTGSQTVNLSYDCDTPVTCLISLRFNDSTNLSENTPSAVSLTFNNEGIAAFSSGNNSALSYADAGTINLSADAVVDGAIITAATRKVNVYPDRLVLSSTSANTANYPAGKNFDFSIEALGANNTVLKNYEAGQLQLGLKRVTPSAEIAAEGAFYYAPDVSIGSKLTETVADVASLPFSDGTYLHSEAYLTEVGSFSLHAQDANYLGHIIVAEPIELGSFIPAFFTVETKNVPVLLMDACAGEGGADGFTYIGQAFDFEQPLEFQVTAKNYQGNTTNNYADVLWKLAPDQEALDTHFTYTDSSVYTGSLSTENKGDIDSIDGTGVFDGQAEITISGEKFIYPKVNGSGVPYAVTEPFQSSIDLNIASGFFTDTDGVCFRDDATSPCKGLSIDEMGGTEQRYGRLALENTYGPETEPLKVTLNAEYYNNGQWLINTLDFCTNIVWDEAAGDLLLSGASELTDNIDNIQSQGDGDGEMEFGTNPSDSDFILNGPGVVGEVTLSLSPGKFPDYLNFNWNKDAIICSMATPCLDVAEDVDNVDEEPDFPSAIVTFGLYRGNDRVINWQEVFK